MTHSLPRPACGDDDTEVLVLPNGVRILAVRPSHLADPALFDFAALALAAAGDGEPPAERP